MRDTIREGISLWSQRPAEPLGVCAWVRHLSIGRNFSGTRSSPGPILPISFSSTAHRCGQLGEKKTLGIGENIEFTSLSSWPGPGSM